MSSKKPNETHLYNDDLQAQRRYTEQKLSEGFDFSLIVAEAFVRGIRDIGYKHTGTALDELIDNAIQAGASNVHIVYDFKGDSTKPVKIAVIDDGHGMESVMIRLAIIWGGTHRENSRDGFGRYGYGLPSASVSQGRRLEVYSLVEGSQLHMGWLDLDEVGKGEYNNKVGRIIIPQPVAATLPQWLKPHVKKVPGPKGFSHGTIVVLDKLDRLSWKTQNALNENLLEHFGVVYRNFLRQVKITVEGKSVEPIDPLFVTPGCRYYDEDDDRAEPLEPIIFEVKELENKENKKVVKVRFSYMPPTFGRIPEEKPKERGKTNKRFQILKKYNDGIIILRNGRQIDVVTKCDWTTFLNDDRYWGVEVDFPATLDEEFAITTSKQQIVISERMWDLLRQAGVWKAILQFRTRGKQDRAKLKETREEAKIRASEAAMQEAERYKSKRGTGPSEEQKAKSERRLQEEAKKRATQTGLPLPDVEEQLRLEILGIPYKVSTETMPGAPFFKVEQIGGQKVLYLNVAHRFYTGVYAGPDSTANLRAALEVLLFVIGDCELDAESERRLFYETERGEWSKQLSVALEKLDQHIGSEYETADINTPEGINGDGSKNSDAEENGGRKKKV
jgi:hypothetical protein